MKKNLTNAIWRWMIPLLMIALLTPWGTAAEAHGYLKGDYSFGLAARADEDTDKPQAIQVRGRVVSQADDLGLPGVTVVEKGTNNGTVTNLNGEYSIEVADANAILVYSYVGFISQEITVGSRDEINISMEE